MSLRPLPQSSEKKEIIARLGLSDEIHKLLLNEAEAAREILSANPFNLTDHSRADPKVVAPYKWDEISETAKHIQILTTVNTCRPETRPYYNAGRYMTNVNEENWVARWYLWRTFRYRDNRSKSRTASGQEQQSPEGGQTTYGSGYYDPARGQWR